MSCQSLVPGQPNPMFAICKIPLQREDFWAERIMDASRPGQRPAGRSTRFRCSLRFCRLYYKEHAPKRGGGSMTFNLVFCGCTALGRVLVVAGLTFAFVLCECAEKWRVIILTPP